MKVHVERPGVVHVVDDDSRFRTALGRALSAAGHAPRLYGSADEYLAAEDSAGPACLIVDLRMPGTNGLDLQEVLTRRGDAHPVIFLSAHGDIPSTVRAMRAGALDFLTKPVQTAVLPCGQTQGDAGRRPATRPHIRNGTQALRHADAGPSTEPAVQTPGASCAQ